MSGAQENAQTSLARALARLAGPQACLARQRGGGDFAVYPGGDLRRRPSARLSARTVRELEADGALTHVRSKDVYILSDAGRAWLARENARPQERYQAQHGEIVDRVVMDGDGDARVARGVEANGVIKRLSALRDGQGALWLSPSELLAAQRLRADWEAGQAGLYRGADWSAPPRSGAARSGGNGFEAALAAGCDARARVNAALNSLAAPLRRVVERVCLLEDGLEAIERREGWPARSGKIALKLGLAQLAKPR